MEITLGYAIAVGGAILVATLIHLLPCLPFFIPHTWPLIHRGVRYLAYPYLLRRHRFLGPWTTIDALTQVVYIASNFFCVGFRASDIAQAGVRAGSLSLINLIPLFLGPHLGFLTDILGVSLSTVRRTHRYSGLMACTLMAFHMAVILTSGAPFILQSSANIAAVIGGSSLGLISLVSWPTFRRLPWPPFRLSYEFFLRLHHMLAAVLAISVILHVRTRFLPQVYIWTTLGIFTAALGLEGAILLRRNGLLVGLPVVGEIFKHGEENSGPVSLTINLGKPLEVEAGQYINVFIPSLGIRSMIQSHPFVVASWTGKKQTTLELIIEPRHGWTKRLHSRKISGTGPSGGLGRVLFTGPHGVPVPVCDYEHHVMIASGYGIIAHLPLLERLVQGMQAREAQARRIRLVWEFKDEGLYNAVRPLLNLALAEDGDLGNRALNISLYTMKVQAEDLSERAQIFNSPMLLKDIIKSEIAEVNDQNIQERAVARLLAKRDIEVKRGRIEQTETNYGTHPSDEASEINEMRPWGMPQGQRNTKQLENGIRRQSTLPVYTEKSRMLITVSASTTIRDEVRSALLPYLNKDITLKQLDYQPQE